MARELTTEVPDVAEFTSFLVISEVGGRTDIALLPKENLSYTDVGGLAEQLALKAPVGDPEGGVTLGYVDAADAAIQADIADHEARVSSLETGAAANIPIVQKGAPNGVAELDGDGLLVMSQLEASTANDPGSLVLRDGGNRIEVGDATTSVHAVTKAQLDALTATDVDAIPLTEKGAALGVATLDAAGLVTPAQLPPAGGSIPLTDKGTPTGVATLDATGHHAIAEVRDGSVIEVSTTPYTVTLSPSTIRAIAGSDVIVLPTTGSSRAVTIVNKSGSVVTVEIESGSEIFDGTGTSVEDYPIPDNKAASFAGTSDGLVWQLMQPEGAGLSAGDQTKLDGIEAGAQVNPAVLADVAIDAGVATLMSTITAAGLKRGVTQHALAGIADRAITAAKLPEAAAKSVLGNSTSAPGNYASVTYADLAVDIGTSPVDQLVAQFLAPEASITVTAPAAAGDRAFQAANMQVWDATNASALVFAGHITAAASSGTKIALVYEDPATPGTYFWMDGSPLGTSGGMTLPVDEGVAGVVAANATGNFYGVVAVPTGARAKRRFGWRYYGGAGTGALTVQGPHLRVRSMVGSTGGATGVTSFKGRLGAVVPTTGDYTADQITDGAAKVMMTTAERSTIAGVGTPFITAVEEPLSVTSGLLSIARFDKITRYTAAATQVGSSGLLNVLAAPGAATFTLTSNIAHKFVVLTNRGTGIATIQAESGRSILGGSISLAVPASATEPVTVCVWRNPLDNNWIIA